MGNWRKLQVLKAKPDGTGWSNDSDGEKLLNDLTIMVGQCLVIFQDEFKKLWTMEKDKSPQTSQKLQILKINKAKDGYAVSWQS